MVVVMAVDVEIPRGGYAMSVDACGGICVEGTVVGDGVVCLDGSVLCATLSIHEASVLWLTLVG